MKLTGSGGIFGKLLGSGGPPPLSSHMVEPGDRFFQIGKGSTSWTVDRVYSTQSCQIPHAVISRGGSFPDTKILSVKTLVDTTLYRSERRDENSVNSIQKRRRIDDPPSRN